jgi:DnaK suppressor protein
MAKKVKKTAASKTAKKKKQTKPKKTARKAVKKKVTSPAKKRKTLKKTTKKTVKKAAVKKTDAKKKTAKKATTKKTPAKRKTTVTAATKKMKAKSSAAAEKVKKEVEEISPAELRARALKKIKGYSKKDLDFFKEIIMEKRDEIIEQLQNLKEQMLDPTTGEYINENSPYSLHMAEQGTDAMEREKTFLYAQRENKFLGYLEDALKRIESGVYGICVECIEEPQHLCETCPLIPKERLIAVPHSQHCLPIKQRQEKR